jgi:beta-ureidopropionase
MKSYFGIRVTPVLFPLTSGLSVEQNLNTAECLIYKIIPESTDIVCFPEGFLYRRVRYSYVHEIADEIQSRVMEKCQLWAKYLKCYLFIPVITCHFSKFYNTVLVYSPEGNHIGSYNKYYPWPSRPDYTLLEKGVAPGNEITDIKTRFGSIGIQTCFDVNWDYGWRTLKEHNVKLVLFPSEYGGGFTLRVRAWQIRTPVISVVLSGSPSRAIDISGEELQVLHQSNFPETINLNLNRTLVHSDHNLIKIRSMLASEPEIKMVRLPYDNVILAEGPLYGSPIEATLKQWGIANLDEYLVNASIGIDAFRDSKC